MNKYTTYCTKEQTEMAHKLGAPLQEHPFEASIIKANEKMFPYLVCINEKYYMVPTAEQMYGWLRKEKHVKFMFENRDEYHVHYIVSYKQDVIDDDIDIEEHCILAAIDSALNYLEKGVEIETKSIRERAKEFAKKSYPSPEFEYQDYIEMGYCHGATEQNRIACKKERERAELNYCIACDCYDCCVKRYDCESFNNFRKAMESQTNNQ